MSFADREESVCGGAPVEMYQFQSSDGTWLSTSADHYVEMQGKLFAPAAIKRTQTNQDNDAKNGHITVTVAHTHPVAAKFVAFIPTSPLSLTIFRSHVGEPGDVGVVVFSGRVLSARFAEGDTCEMDCAPDSEMLTRNVASQVYQKQCNRVLFDAGCGVSASGHRLESTVTAVGAFGGSLTVAGADAQPNGWWAYGYAERANGDRRMVTSHSGVVVVLIMPFSSMAANEAIILYAGCDRMFTTCRNKFGNAQNFLGFPWIPSKNPFSSGVV
jgi:uncharacterized phage protein (TIGR02218 family)